MPRTIIKGGTVYTPFEELDVDVVIEDEIIIGLIRNMQPQSEDVVIDATGHSVLPGIVDAHTHIQLDTGLFQTADDWQVTTRAAAAGGITTVVDFVNQIPGESFQTALETRLEESEPSLIDYCYHMVVTKPDDDNNQLRAELESIFMLGMNSVKLFTTYRPNYYLDDAAMLRIFRALPHDMVAMIHCENDAIVTEATDRLKSTGQTGWKHHGKSRPLQAEAEAVGRMIRLAALARPGSPPNLYIAHCTNGPVVEEIIHGSGNPWYVPVIGESCPQYLLLNNSVYNSEHPEHFILQPPLRPEMERQTMIRAIHEGVIPVISTDSCDYLLKQKQEYKTFYQTPGGLPGLELLLPLVISAFSDDTGSALTDILPAITINPARIFGLFPQKGAIQVGADADLVICDLNQEWQIDHTDLHHIAGYSPYQGHTVRGKVKMTFSRGELIFQQDQDEFAQSGRGKFIKAGAFQPPLSAL